MFNQNKLKAKMVETGISVLKLCRFLGICEATFYRKMTREGDFTRFEIEKIVEVLHLTANELNEIFFANKLA